MTYSVGSVQHLTTTNTLEFISMRSLLIALFLLIGASAHAQFMISAIPQRVRMDPVAIGTQDSALIVLTNVTLLLASNIQFEFDGPDASNFAVNAVTSEITAGSSSPLLISFTCMRAGEHEARLLIRGFIGGDTIRSILGFVYLEANGDASTAGISPFYQAITFGGVALGQNATRTFTLSNTSDADITVGLKSTSDNGLTFEDYKSVYFSIEDVGGETMPRLITIGAGQTISINAVFTPTSLENVTDSIYLMWGGRMTHVALFGYGEVTPILTVTWARSFSDTTSISSEPGDFVADSIGKTDVWIARVHNNSASPQMISLAQSVIAMPSPFTIPVNVAPITVAAGGTADIDVIYTGHGPTPFIDTLIFLDEFYTPFAGAQLVGYVRARPSVRVWVGNISGKPGETDSLEITIASPLPTEAVRAQLTLAFNASVLVPQFPVSYDETSEGTRTVVTTVEVSGHAAGSLLAALPFTIALGDQTISEVTLPSVQWLSSTGAVLPISTESGDGTTTVEDERNVNANGGSIIVKLSPSPAITTVNVDFSGVDGDVDVDLYDLTGVHLMSVPASSSNGLGNCQLNVASLARGIYAIRVSDSTHSMVRRIIIE